MADAIDNYFENGEGYCKGQGIDIQFGPDAATPERVIQCAILALESMEAVGHQSKAVEKLKEATGLLN